MIKSRTLLSAGVLCAASALQAGLVDIQYAITGGNTYHYTVSNNALAGGVTFFTVFFDKVDGPGLYTNLGGTVLDSPTDWSADPFEPSAINLNGFVDWSTALGGIAVGDALSGFSVSFNYSGTGIPGSQYFEVYDANFQVLNQGQTSPIPEPTSALAFALATVAGVAGVRLHRALRAQK